MQAPEPSGVITLTTDFGLEDHYAGVMKGVILSIFPAARIVDLSHSVAAYSIEQAAFVLDQSCRWFPRGTVHVAVVDPGVGSERRALLAEAGGSYFVAPDNGALSYVFEHEQPTVRALDAERFALKEMSRTFHGRDLFAPAAAWLAKGTPFAEFGEEIEEYVRLPPSAPLDASDGRRIGRVLNIDRFGNIVTSFKPSELAGLAGGFTLSVGSLKVSRRIDSYAEAQAGEPFLIAGSSGHVEVSLREASAAEAAQAQVGDPVELRPR